MALLPVPFLKLAMAVMVAAGLSACGTTASYQPRTANDDQTISHGSLYGDFLVASYAGSTRDSQIAAKRYLAALRQDPTNETLLERAFIFSVAAGDMEEASQLAPMISAANPKSDLAPLIRGVIALQAKDYVAAKAFFQASHPQAGIDLMSALTMAWTDVGAGDAAGARALLTQGADQATNIFVSYHRARLEEVLGNAAGADAAYESVDAATGGKSLTVALGYSAWLQATGRADQAGAVLRKFLQSTPGNPVGVSALNALRHGKPIARRITTPQQGASEAFYGIASAVGDGEVQDAAIVYLRLALYLDPENDGALAFLAGAMERAGRKDDAVALYLKVQSSSPFYVTAEVAAAGLLDDTNHTDQAIKILTRLEGDEATGALAASALGDVYRTRERWREAVDAYTRSIDRIGPNYTSEDWPVFYARGIALERSGRWDDAEADFRRALQLSPDQPLVLNYLAYAWITRGVHQDEALAMLQKAVTARPDDGYIIDSLGWAYYRLGRYDLAKQTLEQAMNFSPYEAEINEHLGDVYWRLGRQREAQYLWAHALKLKPEKDRIAILQTKLRDGLDAGEAFERRQASTEAPVSGPAAP